MPAPRPRARQRPPDPSRAVAAPGLDHLVAILARRARSTTPAAPARGESPPVAPALSRTLARDMPVRHRCFRARGTGRKAGGRRRPRLARADRFSAFEGAGRSIGAKARQPIRRTLANALPSLPGRPESSSPHGLRTVAREPGRSPRPSAAELLRLSRLTEACRRGTRAEASGNPSRCARQTLDREGRQGRTRGRRPER